MSFLLTIKALPLVSFFSKYLGLLVLSLPLLTKKLQIKNLDLFFNFRRG
ncbi:hypothetical protein BGAFAR04_K0025 (plasmid) [Borreliella garinii Far04]|nr:hypothetical protein BGAFAR04_K0025 [Borreliella garinii Far04]